MDRRLVTFGGPIVQSAAQSVTTGGVTSGPFPIPNFQQLILRVLPATHDLEVVVAWTLEGSGSESQVIAATETFPAGVASTFTWQNEGNVIESIGLTAVGGTTSVAYVFAGANVVPFESAGGIGFDEDNEGGYLDVTTNGPVDGAGLGVHFVDRSGGGTLIESDGAGGFAQLASNNPTGGASLFGSDSGGSNFGSVVAKADGVEITTEGSPASIRLVPDGAAAGDGDIVIGGNSHGSTTVECGSLDGDLQLTSNAGRVLIQGQTYVEIDLGSTGSKYIQTQNLTTVNPGGSGRIWNNGGVLNIT